MSATMTALVVVSDATVQAELVMALHKRLVDVAIGTAVELLERPYDLVYNDVAGTTHDERLRRKLGHTRWIMVGPPDVYRLRHALHAGFDDYLVLPLHAADLDYGLQTQHDHKQTVFDFTAQVQQQSLVLMSRLASSLAHEINNPLTPILGIAEMLHEAEPVQSPTHTATSVIMHSAYRIASTVKNIMTFTQPLQRHDLVDLGQLLSQVLRLTEAQLREQHIAYALHVPPTPVFLTASSAELKQALFLLIDHARTTMPEGGTMAITLTPPDDACSTMALVEICDSAPPLAASYLLQLFEAFYSSGTLGVHAGLNLAVVRQVIERHGGQVGAAASNGIGNNLWFSLLIETIALQNQATKL